MSKIEYTQEQLREILDKPIDEITVFDAIILAQAAADKRRDKQIGDRTGFETRRA